MNDFSDLETQLKGLKPAPLSQDFVARVERAMSEPAALEELPSNVVRPHQFRRQWLAGLSLAAAAAVLLLFQVRFRTPQKTEGTAAASPPSGSPATQAITENSRPNAFIPTGSTQVVLHKRDEGLLFASNTETPMRRLRSVTQETLQWKNPATGASLQVSYPSEQVELVPISAQ